jgi:hypothetical protein
VNVLIKTKFIIKYVLFYLLFTSKIFIFTKNLKPTTMDTCNSNPSDKLLFILLDRATSISKELIDLQNRTTDVTQRLAGGLRTPSAQPVKDSLCSPVVQDYCQNLASRFDVIEGTILDIRREISVLEQVI